MIPRGSIHKSQIPSRMLFPALGILLCLWLPTACKDSTDREEAFQEIPSHSSPLNKPIGTSALDHGSPSMGIAQPQNHARIIAFGNSLTSGLGVAPHEAYPAQLQKRLDRAGYIVRVMNAGVSGETTAGGLRRVDWVLKSRPSLVILELGGNDGLRGLALSHMRANLEAIIRRLQDEGVVVVLAGMKIPPNYGVEYTRGFETIYQDLAKQYNLPFMPFFLEGVALQDGLMQADGIHPTAGGYTVIADRLLPILEPLLKSNATLQMQN